MAPYVPEEVNVFSVPHSRMKELVNSYFVLVRSTNFSSTVDLEMLLASLYKTFTEFKTHEHIENKLILRKLRAKMRQLARQSTAVCNCHKGSRLTQMLHLLEDGFNKSTVQDRINYGLKLTKELEEFTSSFIPHMQQEEEVFQPLLLEYFTYDELCQLRLKVIEQHFRNKESEQQHEEKFTLTETEKEYMTSSASSDSEDDDCKVLTAECSSSGSTTTTTTSIACLPAELLLHILSLLSVQDLCRCAQVCWMWNQLTKDSRLWTDILPTNWARGVWSARSVSAVYTDDCPTDSEVVDADTETPSASRSRELRILNGLTKYLLPTVHQCVQRLVINNSSALDDNMLDNMLSLCYNIQHLDLSHCSISDSGLRRLSGRPIVSLILSGCTNITDTCLVQSFSTAKQCYRQQLLDPTDCTVLPSSGSCSSWQCLRDCINTHQQTKKVYLLQHLDVSGCWRLTDNCLWALCQCSVFPNLHHLDLSGCMLLSGAALKAFVSLCPSLDASCTYYCDNIIDGPFPHSANGCRNLECSSRVCCRFGH